MATGIADRTGAAAELPPRTAATHPATANQKVNTMAKRNTVGGDEVDAFAGNRRAHNWRAGQLKKLKAGANRRDRRQARREIHLERAH
ncbi:MAG: hypothetical protein DI630_00835 [Gordonia sp. (in: high G+C Gram-positive bacteria)]|nr:MAG: hypothetical protein DI630_00835 [Gordonia sp. (in: high G+C Gram-positive bacteria)]